MIQPNHLRAGRSLRTWLVCCLVLAASGTATLAQPEAQEQSAAGSAQQLPPDSVQTTPSEHAKSTGTKTEAGTAVVVAGAHAIEPTPGKRQLREAEDAYLSGAKKLEHDELSAAESEFQHALKLDPGNRDYALAISVAREHRLTELVQQSTKARQAGDQGKAETLLGEARAIDPENPIVLEHSGPFSLGSAGGSQPVPAEPGQAQPGKNFGAIAIAPLADRSRMLADAGTNEPWRQVPALAGPIQLAPTAGVKSFHLSGVAADLLRSVASAYGINAVVDDSVQPKTLHFDLENVDYRKAMDVLMEMTQAFAVPMNETSILVARDDEANRARLQHQMQETIYVPGATTEQANELMNVAKNIFNVKQIYPAQGTIIVRAPEDVLEPMNRTLRDLVDSTGEVLVEVKMYEVDTTRMTNVGATIPTQFGSYSVDAAAASLVSANQSIVQEAIAQGLLSATASNLEIAAALIGSGLVQSSLLSSTVGVFGNGLTQSGITETGSVGFNLGLNTSDSKTLDDVQQRVGDRQEATFREGTRYPIITSTYTSGLSTPASALGNASINGVSIASLLSQYTGGTSVTIPQVTYEDLGVTLKATPTIQRSGRVSLKLDLKIESLSGSTSDGNPILDSRQFTSGLTVADGESVLMVSNVSKTETAAMTGIPGLSELPGFQMPLADNVEKDTGQLVLVVTPHVVRWPAGLFAGPRISIEPQALN